MITRTRAWRRKNSRKILAKVAATKDWFVHQFHDPKPKKVKAIKQHRHGALSSVQALKQGWSLNQELREGY